MSKVKWTKEQLLAIKEKGKNILVAAAAGSGKTAVLVERIINKIVNEKIDIDKILVVTFTKSATSEMRERILDAIYENIEKNPADIHLQKQITLISKANICTIDSFCLDVVKNNFFEIGISPNLKIAESTEIEILKQETLEDLFEEKYETGDQEFLDLINIYTNYRGDENLKELILEIYKFIQSMPFPEKWLNEKVEMFNLDYASFQETTWGQILFSKVKENLQDCILKLQNEIDKIKLQENTDELIKTLSEDIDKIKVLFQKQNWDDTYNEIRNTKFSQITRSKKVPEDIKEEVKEKRNEIKKVINDLEKNILVCTSEEALADIKNMYSILVKIKKIVLEFSDLFLKTKQDKNIMDFNDIEHYALNILYKGEEDNYVAKKYQEKYQEILIDEYQDSNLVQEYILNAISRKNNIFMVGDVKQSIYKFRGARPELFLEKYEKYQEKDLQDENGLKIQLFKNFRSRKNILDITNIIFSNIMSKNLGDINYTEEEYLNLGAEYPEGKNLETELHILDLKEEESFDREESQETEKVEDIVLEAKFVANKIKELIDSGYLVCNKDKTYRKITYKDIAILLRSAQGIAPIYEQEISKLNLPVFSDITVGYLDTMEIQVIMSLLEIIDNPINDIAIVTVARSAIGNFTDNELIEIRLENKNKTFYEAMCEYVKLENSREELKEKIENFLKQIEEFRKCQEYMPLDELIWKIYTDTGYYNYVSLMPNGTLRTANLKILFEKAKQYEQTSFKGLYNFIRFIDRLKSSNKDMTGAKLIGENEDVIRIMSIHKSKGLEFPVVFLCSTGKKFNMRDINSNPILLHQDIGLGPKYINYEKGIRYDTLSREAVKCKSRQEVISEEMRILYVALTRAKEKLIITGMEKDYKKSISSKEDVLSMYKNISKNKGISKHILQSNMSYLSWIELAYLNSTKELENILKVYTYKKEELIKELIETENETKNLTQELDEIQTKDIENVKHKLDWEYDYKIANNILTKTSVTKLKDVQQNQENKVLEYDVPKFLAKEKKITSSQKGTLTHLVLQKLNTSINYDQEKIMGLIDSLVEKNIITEAEKEAIDISKIYEFTCSNIWQEMKNAKQIEREKPFYINISSQEAYQEDLDQDILVQGIIDLYYVTNDDRLILVDYKTDRLNQEKEFIQRYKRQLEIYKKALEQATGKKVNATYIYSTNLGKTIEI